MLNLYEYLISFALAFIISFSATPAAKKLAFRLGAIDVPKDERRMHRKPIALMGGLAVAVSFFISALFNVAGHYLNIPGVFTPDRQFAGMLAGALIILAVGAADDIKPVSPRLRILFQIIAAIIVVYSGTIIRNVTNPFAASNVSHLNDFIAYPLTVLWIVGITNAINLIDGLDGLAAGVSSIASLSLFFVSIGLGDVDAAIITAILAGSTLGFLPYNFNPARIFIGSTGAYFLGFILSVTSIQGMLKTYAAVAIAIPLLVLGLPLFDTILAIVRRLISGKSIAEGDRGHFHHRLVDVGLSHKQTVVVLYTASAALGLCAIVLVEKGPLSAIILVLAVSVFIIAGGKYMSDINKSDVSMSDINNKSGVNDSNIILVKPEGEDPGKLNSKEAEVCEPCNGRFLRDLKKDRLNVMVVFGTRPDAVKMAPLIKELERCSLIDPIVCVTAQHRQMLDQVLDIFDIVPDVDLDIMQSRQTLEQITTRALEGLSKVMEQLKPDIVLVHGDTTTCFVGSLAAFYKQIRVGHVEAGLRTYDKYFPYPEEMNRKLAGTLADLHFAPTPVNRQNLLTEGIKDSSIYVTGNTVIDALKTTVTANYVFKCEKLRTIDFMKKRVITVTAHRRENLGEPLANICTALGKIADKYDDVEIVYSVHLNPVVQETARNILGRHPKVHLTEPLDVRDLHNLMSRSSLVLTDSGGLQEEAPSLGKPVLVLRNETERPEAVEAGTVKLAGTDVNRIIELASALLDNPDQYNKMAKAVNPYGDGTAAQRIVQALLFEFGYSENKPASFG